MKAINKKQSVLKKGFTLVETLVAITVLLLSIAAPLSIAAKALFAAYYARDQITAYYLAEEAIEYVKNSRDITFLNDALNASVPIAGNTNWLLGLEDCINSGAGFEGCYVDATEPFNPYADNDGVNSCLASPDGVCPKMVRCPSTATNIDTGLWGYGDIPCNGSTETSKFTRKVVITPQPNTNASNEEVLITVTVSWQGQGYVAGTQSFTLVGSMLNWERK